MFRDTSSRCPYAPQRQERVDHSVDCALLGQAVQMGDVRFVERIMDDGGGVERCRRIWGDGSVTD